MYSIPVYGKYFDFSFKTDAEISLTLGGVDLPVLGVATDPKLETQKFYIYQNHFDNLQRGKDISRSVIK